jgi:tetratricopeptide (TPR) repeat protein
MESLVRVYSARGRHVKALPLLRRLLEIREGVLGADNPQLEPVLETVAIAYSAQGYYTEAEPFYRRLLAIKEKAAGPQNPEYAASLEQYALVLRKTHRRDEAARVKARAKDLVTVPAIERVCRSLQ